MNLLKPNEEAFHLAGDDEHGYVGRHNLKTGTLASNLPVRYDGRWGSMIMGIDIYPDLGEGLMAHIICPRCRKALRISGKNKKIEFSKEEGKLFIERFTCTWETSDVNSERRMEFGMSLCNTSLVIENNRARDV